MSQLTDRRERFGHLLGTDRYRVVLRWNDGSFSTESYDELTIDRAKATAAALLAPARYRGDWPDSVEIGLASSELSAPPTANGQTPAYAAPPQPPRPVSFGPTPTPPQMIRRSANNWS